MVKTSLLESFKLFRKMLNAERTRPENSQYNRFCLALSKHTCIFDRSSISVLGAPDSQSTHGAIRQFPVTSDEVHFSFTSPKREVLETSVPVLQYSPLLLSPQDLSLKDTLHPSPLSFLPLTLSLSLALHFSLSHSLSLDPVPVCVFQFTLSKSEYFVF